eukprot:s7260_g3.t1
MSSAQPEVNWTTSSNGCHLDDARHRGFAGLPASQTHVPSDDPIWFGSFGVLPADPRAIRCVRRGTRPFTVFLLVTRRMLRNHWELLLVWPSWLPIEARPSEA